MERDSVLGRRGCLLAHTWSQPRVWSSGPRTAEPLSRLIRDVSRELLKELVRWKRRAVRVLLANEVLLGVAQRNQAASQFSVQVATVGRVFWKVRMSPSHCAALELRARRPVGPLVCPVVACDREEMDVDQLSVQEEDVAQYAFASHASLLSNSA